MAWNSGVAPRGRQGVGADHEHFRLSGSGLVRQCEWILPTNNSAGDQSRGSRYLLFEQQERVKAQEAFTRVVLLMENKSGVQNSGSLTFAFDPSYQELNFHRVQIHREGQVLERLDLAKIRVIQPEPDLDGHIITGKQTALLIVEDLRIGDALEYAYTLHGRNPILNGHFATRHFVQSSTPVNRQRLRVIWSADTPICLRQHLTEIKPKQEPCDGGTTYTWDYASLEEIPYEDGLPGSYEPYPYIEISDFDSWARVVEWALPLYEVSRSSWPAELRDLTARWASTNASAEAKGRTALEFVQDELRYTGIEIGAESYRPTPPAETFRLRYGDCKAKSLLLCGLLREMGMEAYPVLVSSDEREAVANRLPSPIAFNHAIVKLFINGKAIWVDPTRSHQGGSLWERSLPPYRKALVLRDGVAVLEDVPASTASSLRRVVSTFRLKDFESPAALTITSTFRGSSADSMRSYLAGAARKDTAKNYLNFYARYYPGIKDGRAMEIDDQRMLNVLKTTEYYKVQDVWKMDKESGQRQAWFFAEALDGVLDKPRVRLRKMPLALPYPMRREHEVIVHLPKLPWNIPPHHQVIKCDAFEFGCDRVFTGSTMQSRYYCETRMPSVPAEKTADYLAKVEKMEDLLGDRLYPPDNRVASVLTRVNWLMVVIAGFGFVAALVGGVWVWFATSPKGTGLVGEQLPPSFLEMRLRGLGGWLVFVGIGLCIAPLRLVNFLIIHWEGFFSTATWQAVTVPGRESYHPLYGPLLTFEVLGNSVLLGVTLLVLALFFARRRIFPKVFIMLLLTGVAFTALDEGLGRLIPQVAQGDDGASMRALWTSAITAMIWTAYMVRSRRVKLTFVR